MNFLDEKIAAYAEKYSTPEDKVLKEINLETHRKIMKPQMLSGHLQGELLTMISFMIKPKMILEIGTYTGYSALCMAEGLKNEGILHTLDINEEYTSIAKRYFNRSKYSKNIKQHLGNALDIIPKLECNFQLAFISAN